MAVMIWMDNSIRYQCDGCGASGGTDHGYPDTSDCECSDERRLGVIYTKPMPFLELKGTICHRVYLPTETVVRKPEMVTPQEARIFRTSYIVRGSEIINLRAARLHPGFTGTYDELNLLLAEIWDDYGMDGHVAWQLRGWEYIALRGYVQMTDDDWYRVVTDGNWFLRPEYRRGC